MTMQDWLTQRIKEIIFREREKQPVGYTVVQTGIVWVGEDDKWVLLLQLQDDSDYNKPLKPYKRIAL